jgi:AraC family transcriptional regulator
MNPAQKALWFIESHLADELTLEEIAGVGGVSRFHMVRAFAAATGLSVMRYVRARRLSEAARALAGGAPDILTLALDADYASHEAFTRAFRDHFGVTPEMVRSSTRIDNLGLQEPIVMDSTLMDNLPPPRFEISKPLLVAGLGERYTWEEWRPRHSRPVAALSSVGGEYSRPDRKGGLRRLLQRRRRR